ncbi:hypothetical protein P8452_55497 [Trifolium repens]|nr:hypothetical protein P8452_55497 [Trifolium repens]
MALLAVGVFAIPSQYILRRWSKDVRSKHLKRKTDEDVSSNKERFDRLYEKTIEFIEEGSLSHESYNFACHALGEALKQCATINQSLKIDKENIDKNKLGDTPLLDPRPSKTKGDPSQRMKSGIEKGRKRRKKLIVLKSKKLLPCKEVARTFINDVNLFSIPLQFSCHCSADHALHLYLTLFSC